MCSSPPCGLVRLLGMLSPGLRELELHGALQALPGSKELQPTKIWASSCHLAISKPADTIDRAYA